MPKKRRPFPLQHTSPSSSKMKYEGQGDDVMMARDRLKEALQDIIQSDEESKSSSSQDESSERKEVKQPLKRRRKRKSPLDVDLGFHHTSFVMKLFDRSVDLAQFKEETPLYPICRAWIANQPRIPLPYPASESPEIKKEMDDESVDLEKAAAEGKDIYKMPPPTSPPCQNRIPQVEMPPVQGISLDYSSDSLPSAEELLKSHRERWVNVRRKWIEVAQANEARFAKSGKILNSIFQN